jgi:hypothetical protein
MVVLGNDLGAGWWLRVAAFGVSLILAAWVARRLLGAANGESRGRTRLTQQAGAGIGIAIGLAASNGVPLVAIGAGVFCCGLGSALVYYSIWLRRA